MKVPWKKEDADGDTAAAVPTTDSTVDVLNKRGGHTEGKGRPTPSRREAEGRRRGPVAPAPQTRGEARARKKEIKASQTPAERKLSAEERRQARTEQREKMMAGDEKYLMPRDKGPVRRYVRDIVDSRRNLAGLFMPFAVVLIIVMFVPSIAAYSTFVMLAFVIFLAVDGVILGRLVSKRVRERFPDSTDGGLSLGWYSFSRAMQMRRMRAPRPQASPGDAV
ncbi:DUF3043 domain-containing protein [Williamsia sterculiae]|uniref:DUF3043 domain-containing protein n=1 Tax=Williamsia sterculiae TaxID=1344003 RepID=UPI000970238E|nr:DUF3043 domain-containing protein [Williamsia sterculiae]